MLTEVAFRISKLIVSSFSVTEERYKFNEVFNELYNGMNLHSLKADCVPGKTTYKIIKVIEFNNYRVF